MTAGRDNFSSMISLRRMPTMPAGMLAMSTFPQREKVPRRSSGDFLREKGLSLWKKSTSTAMIEPSCTSTLNTSKKALLRSGSGDMAKGRNSFNRMICPVLLIGSHSVMPCTIPCRIDLRISKKESMGAHPFSGPAPRGRGRRSYRSISLRRSRRRMISSGEMVTPLPIFL